MAVKRKRLTGLCPGVSPRWLDRIPMGGAAGAGGGFIGLVETLRQLTGQTHGHRVEGARHGLVSCFGMIVYDRGLCTSAAISRRSDP